MNTVQLNYDGVSTDCSVVFMQTFNNYGRIIFNLQILNRGQTRNYPYNTSPKLIGNI
ncbi:hypothetical protein SAMN05660413_00975 [Salegentibacter flavus]|uniref:Uncharacterized protein n=1 Tax=Salegentibacter flavus TaxID=287099 RepID=A0A1I4YVJ1_9FLAO|nr:hypothetical protein SAMN05660413_00975 [Salegentibacter flavus]